MDINICVWQISHNSAERVSSAPTTHKKFVKPGCPLLIRSGQKAECGRKRKRRKRNRQEQSHPDTKRLSQTYIPSSSCFLVSDAPSYPFSPYPLMSPPSHTSRLSQCSLATTGMWGAKDQLGYAEEFLPSCLRCCSVSEQQDSRWQGELALPKVTPKAHYNFAQLPSLNTAYYITHSKLLSSLHPAYICSATILSMHNTSHCSHSLNHQLCFLQPCSLVSQLNHFPPCPTSPSTSSDV